MDIDAPTVLHSDWLPIVPEDDLSLTITPESSILREPPNLPATTPDGSENEKDEDDYDLFLDTQARVDESTVRLQEVTSRLNELMQIRMRSGW